MKNWLTCERGVWNNGETWHPEGSVSIDPGAVTAVEDVRVKVPGQCCLIRVCWGADYYCVPRSREEVIADIQSAL